MGLNCGIVGLPNVGKSTLFNALTATQAAQAANFPFCTIEPNVGRLAIPDPRVEALAAIASSAKLIPNQLEVVDIAGLVKGASKGEGLGNQFLTNIRNTDAILHVVRCFEGEVTHVEGSVDPLRDIEIIETELLLADLASLEKRLQSIMKKAKGGDKDSKLEADLLEKILPEVSAGKMISALGLSGEEKEILRKSFAPLSLKPVLYVCNVGEDELQGNAHSAKVAEYAVRHGADIVLISAQIEAEISVMDEADKKDFLADLGLSEPGLNKVVRAGFSLLNLISFFTIGPKEAHAWTVAKGSTAPQAAGVIHSDFEKGFIRAEVIACDDYLSCKGEQGAKDQGKFRVEGKDYIVQDGDVMHFRFNV